MSVDEDTTPGPPSCVHPRTLRNPGRSEGPDFRPQVLGLTRGTTGPWLTLLWWWG